MKKTRTLILLILICMVTTCIPSAAFADSSYGFDNINLKGAVEVSNIDEFNEALKNIPEGKDGKIVVTGKIKFKSDPYEKFKDEKSKTASIYVPAGSSVTFDTNAEQPTNVMMCIKEVGNFNITPGHVLNVYYPKDREWFYYYYNLTYGIYGETRPYCWSNVPFIIGHKDEKGTYIESFFGTADDGMNLLSKENLKFFEIIVGEDCTLSGMDLSFETILVFNGNLTITNGSNINADYIVCNKLDAENEWVNGDLIVTDNSLVLADDYEANLTVDPSSNFVYQKDKVTKIISLKNKKPRTVKIAWKKLPDISYYHVQYKVKGGKYKYLKSITTRVSATAKKLKKGKTYSFRVRTVTAFDSGQIAYSKWSAAKKIKIKR